MYASPWQEIPRYPMMMGYQGVIHSISDKNISNVKKKCIFLTVNAPWQTPMMFTSDEPRQYMYLSARNDQSYSPPLSQQMPPIQGYNQGNIVYPSRSYIPSNQAYDQRNYGYSGTSGHGFNIQTHQQMSGPYRHY